jgi:nitrile hydratase
LIAAGSRVRVRADWPERAGSCHIRTPHYLRGREGEVLRHLGRFPDPEQLAFRRPAPARDLYHVRFPQAALWPDGAGDTTVTVELYDHWLEQVA